MRVGSQVCFFSDGQTLCSGSHHNKANTSSCCMAHTLAFELIRKDHNSSMSSCLSVLSLVWASFTKSSGGIGWQLAFFSPSRLYRSNSFNRSRMICNCFESIFFHENGNGPPVSISLKYQDQRLSWISAGLGKCSGLFDGAEGFGWDVLLFFLFIDIEAVVIFSHPLQMYFGGPSLPQCQASPLSRFTPRRFTVS